MIRFCRYSLLAIVALVGPRWMGLVGEASASFRATSMDCHEITIHFIDPSTASAGAAESPAAPSDPVPTEVELRLGLNMPANNAAGSSTTSTHNGSPGASPAVVPEVVSPPILLVTLLRIAEERVTDCPCPSSVFEPPRAV